jgi:Tol biopolymer transport system component
MPSFTRRPLAPAFALLFLALSAQLPAQNPSNESKRDPRIGSVLTELSKVRTLHQTAISPDGKYLAWVVDAQPGGGPTEIELAPLSAPSATTRVTAASKAQICEEGQIAWSPDSTTLVFLSNCQPPKENPAQSDFFLYSAAAKSAPRRLTHLHGIPEAPAFSPDGQQLGFLYVEGASRKASPLAAEKPPAGVIGEDGLEIKRIAAVPIAGGELHQITPASLYAYEFDWSPNSQEVAYVAAPPPGENNWWVA